MDEEKFAKGFNAGYMLRDHKPELMDTLIKGMQQEKDDYLEGLLEGSKQRANELERERIKASMEKEKEQGKEKGRDMSR